MSSFDINGAFVRGPGSLDFKNGVEFFLLTAMPLRLNEVLLDWTISSASWGT